MAEVFGIKLAPNGAPSQPVRRIEPRYPKGTPTRYAIDLGLLLLGAFVVALAFNVLLKPNTIAPSGVVGVSLLLKAKFGIEPAFSQWGINVVLLVIFARVIKRHVLIKTVIGSIALPLFVWATRNWTPLTGEPILAAIFGGLGIGLGVGLIFRGEGSVGGFTLMAPLMQKRFGLSVGTAMAILDCLVMLAAAIVINPERALLGFVAIYLTRRAVDTVQSGVSTSKIALIISEHSDDIKGGVMEELQRGLTVLPAQGGWTGAPRDLLMVVVGSTETLRLQTLVRSIDPRAFVVVCDAREVIGQGFRVGD